MLAHFSGDTTLCDAFHNDEDIHARVASQVYGVPLEAVTPPIMRRSAKAVNFGVIYGQSPFGLAKALRHRQGAKRRHSLMRTSNAIRGVDEFFTQILEDCRENGYVSNHPRRGAVPISGIRRVVAPTAKPS